MHDIKIGGNHIKKIVLSNTAHILSFEAHSQTDHLEENTTHFIILSIDKMI